LGWLAYEQSGVLTYRQAVDLLGPGRVRHLAASGRWRTIARGIVLTSNNRLDHDQRLWVAVLAAGAGAVLAGATAVAEGAVRGLRSGPVHVLVPGSRAPSTVLRTLPIDMCGVRVHRTTSLPAGHLQVGRPPRTSMARSLVDAASWAASGDEARTILAAACQQRRITPAEITTVLADLPRARRRALIARTIDDIAGGAEALSELDLLRLCRRHGIPEPDQQEHRTDASGRRRYLDAYWRRWGLHVEVDGAHHMDVQQWEDDMLRQNDVWISGDRILRFPASLVRRNPTMVANQIRAALEAGGYSGS
jgi:hypothetical protein